MPKPISFGDLDFKIVSSMEEARGVPEEDTPFRIAILGDFSGRENRGIFEPELAGRKPLFIDRDNIDNVLAKLNVEIKLPILAKDSPPVSIRFKDLDDFHPDYLFEKLEIFQALRDTRQGIKDPSTFAAVTKKIRQTEKTAEAPSPESMEESLEEISKQTTGDLLDQILEETRGTKPESEWDRFLHQVVQPHLVPDVEPQQEEMIASVDAATSELMRMILHHPDFQAIEASWRAVHFLISRLETDDQLKLYILDISKAELAADLGATEDLKSTGTYKLLVEQTVETFGGEPWAVIAGNYRFDQTVEDIAQLGRMAKIARAAGAPFIAGASETALGCESLADTPNPDDWQKPVGTEVTELWKALRKLPEASYIGLALPRIMLRLPYGEDTDSIEGFAFEEISDVPDHTQYVWGYGVFACVYLLGQSFSQYGWNFQPGAINSIENLPLHVYTEQGESRTKPCAEAVLTQYAAEKILDKGLMLLLSFKNQDIVRLARFQSIADPAAHLAGQWS